MEIMTRELQKDREQLLRGQMEFKKNVLEPWKRRLKMNWESTCHYHCHQGCQRVIHDHNLICVMSKNLNNVNTRRTVEFEYKQTKYRQ